MAKVIHGIVIASSLATFTYVALTIYTTVSDVEFNLIEKALS